MCVGVGVGAYVCGCGSRYVCGCVGVLGGGGGAEVCNYIQAQNSCYNIKDSIEGFWHSECSCTVPELAMRVRYSCISVRLCNPCSWAARLLTSSWSKLDQPLGGGGGRGGRRKGEETREEREGGGGKRRKEMEGERVEIRREVKKGDGGETGRQIEGGR